MVDINDDEDVRYDISETFLDQMTDLWDGEPHPGRKQRRSNCHHRRDSAERLQPLTRPLRQAGHLAALLEILNDPEMKTAAWYECEGSLAHLASGYQCGADTHA